MCTFLQYFYSCGKDASGRFRIGACINASGLTRCRDRDSVVILKSICIKCYHGEKRRHPGPVRPTPPPSPDTESGGEEVVWIVESKHSLFHQQEGFVTADPWAREREKHRLRGMPGTEREPIEIDVDDEVEESPMVARRDEDPFVLDGMRPGDESKWKGKLSRLLSRSKSSEMSLCCKDAELPLDRLVMEDRVIDDGCESTV